MSTLQVDPTTGEILSQNIMVKAETIPAISIDINDVDLYYFDPDKLIEKINNQAGLPVFDINSSKGRKECASHSANIIRCIAPIAAKSKEKASDAKKIVNQDVSFRKYTEERIREIATFHRKPLTEYEEEQKLIEEARTLAALKIEEARLYLIDWQDAIDFDELYTLRKARELAEQIAEVEIKTIADKLEFDEAVARELVNLNRPWEAQPEESFYSDAEIDPTVFKIDVEMVTIPKSEYDELLIRSERLFELETEFA